MRRLQLTWNPWDGIDLLLRAEEAQFAVRSDQIERLGPSVDFCDLLIKILLIAHFEIIHRSSCCFLIRDEIVKIAAMFVVIIDLAI